MARHFHAAGDEVVVLSRRPQEAPWRTVFWDGEKLSEWAREFEGADAVINLAGRSVNCRYHARNRREIMNSRVRSVRAVGQAIGLCRQPPRAWLQMSTATIYAHRYDAANDERTGILGGCEPDVPDSWRFSIDVARAWEEACDAASTPDTRKLKLRLAMLMNVDRGGTFDLLLRLVRYGLSGRAGNGQQFMSWIHEHDFVRTVQWLIAHDEIAGAVNVAAPCPLPNGEFMHALRSAWGTRLGLPAADWMVEVGTWLMRSESELILKSRRVVPGRLIEAGFDFACPTWPAAARELCDRWQACRGDILPPDTPRKLERRPASNAFAAAPRERNAHREATATL